MDDSAIDGSVNAELRATPLSIAVNVAVGVATGIFILPFIFESIAAVATWHFHHFASAVTPDAVDFYAFIGCSVVFYPIAWTIRGRFSPAEVSGVEDGNLVVRAPGSWKWLFVGGRRHLEVRSVERTAPGMVIRGVFGKWWDLARFELDVNEDGAEAPGPVLADLLDVGAASGESAGR
jgi:hypothetical protein